MVSEMLVFQRFDISNFGLERFGRLKGKFPPSFVKSAWFSQEKTHINIKGFLAKTRKTRKTKKTRENQGNSRKPDKPKNKIKTRKTRKTKKTKKNQENILVYVFLFMCFFGRLNTML